MMLTKFVEGDFHSYEEFVRDFKINVPPHFNFAYDVSTKYGGDSDR